MRGIWTRFLAIVLTATFCGFAHTCCVGNITSEQNDKKHTCCPIEDVPAADLAPCRLCQSQVYLAVLPSAGILSRLDRFDAMPFAFEPPHLFRTDSAGS